MSDKPKFNQEQYDLLMKCSKQGDITEWTDFRSDYLEDENPSLEGADFSETKLHGVDLRGAKLQGAKFYGTNLQEAKLQNADLGNAQLQGAELQGADLRKAYLKNSNLVVTKLNNAKLNDANLSLANLSGANLSGANLSNAIIINADLKGATLKGAILFSAYLNGSNLSGTNLECTNFNESFLREVLFCKATLKKTTLRGADLKGANLEHTIIIKADLAQANLKAANLIGTELNSSNISGAILYGTSRDDWIIDGIECDYVYWDKAGKERTPKDSDFKPGEFETLYKTLPTITYYFDDEFNPITPLVMDRVVSSINQKHPQFELQLDSFHSRGTPHAIFTVLHKNYADEAQKKIVIGYEKTIHRLEGKVEILREIVSGAVDRPQLIQNDGTIIHNSGSIDHMGNNFGDIKSGRDTNIATDNATMTVENTKVTIVKNDFESLAAALIKHNVAQEDLSFLKDAIESDQDAPEHKEQSFGQNVEFWYSNMCLKAGSLAWRINEGIAASLLAGALRAYYGWA